MVHNPHPQYRPGAIVNGHYMASDLRWYPLQAQPQTPPVVIAKNTGTTVGVWVIVGILTIPLWIWFTPLILLGLFIWGMTLGSQAMWRSHRWWGLAALWSPFVAFLAIPLIMSAAN